MHGTELLPQKGPDQSALGGEGRVGHYRPYTLVSCRGHHRDSGAHGEADQAERYLWCPGERVPYGSEGVEGLEVTQGHELSLGGAPPAVVEEQHICPPPPEGGAYPYTVVPRPAVAVEGYHRPVCLRCGEPPASQEETVLGAEGHLLVRDAELPGGYEPLLAGTGRCDAPGCDARGERGRGRPGNRYG